MNRSDLTWTVFVALSKALADKVRDPVALPDREWISERIVCAISDAQAKRVGVPTEFWDGLDQAGVQR